MQFDVNGNNFVNKHNMLVKNLTFHCCEKMN